MKGVVALGFDGVENRETAAAEHLDVDAEAIIDHFGERKAFMKEITSVGDEFFH